jgi:hypothetical protein
MLLQGPRHLGQLVNLNDPPKIFQRRRILAMFNSGNWRLRRLGEGLEEMTPTIRKVLENWIPDWARTYSSRINELSGKHLCLDKYDEAGWGRSLHPEDSQTLAGLDDPVALMKVWREMEAAANSLEQMELLAGADLYQQKREKNAEALARGAEAAPASTWPEEEDSPRWLN